MTGFILDRSGGVAVVSAVVAILLCAVTAISVDVASLAFHARRVQGEADLAATAAS